MFFHEIAVQTSWFMKSLVDSVRGSGLGQSALENTKGLNAILTHEWENRPWKGLETVLLISRRILIQVGVDTR